MFFKVVDFILVAIGWMLGGFISLVVVAGILRGLGYGSVPKASKPVIVAAHAVNAAEPSYKQLVEGAENAVLHAVENYQADQVDLDAVCAAVLVLGPDLATDMTLKMSDQCKNDDQCEYAENVYNIIEQCL